MKDIKNYLINEKYERVFEVPPFEYEVIKKALTAYKDNDDRKKNTGNGAPDDKQLDKVIKWFSDYKNYKMK